MISPWEGVRGMIVRIYTGDDGQTHFEDLPLPAEGSHNLDRMTWSSPTTSQASATRRARWVFPGSVPLCR
jgi:hypothetical protein